MGDPISIAGSAVGIISLGLQVTQSLVSFYMSYRDKERDLNRTIQNLSNLGANLESLDNALKERKFREEEIESKERIESLIKDCEELIRELKEECDRFQKPSSVLKKAGRHVKYPFRPSTLEKLDEDISEVRANILVALDILNLRDNKTLQDDLAVAKSLLDLIRSSQISTDVLSWLKAPDATVDHNAANVKRSPGTGMWLINSHAFQSWLKEDNSFLWLHGLPGCGKSVLCSTAILHAFRQRNKLASTVGIAFFYFSFNDESKQDATAMLRALILQLSTQLDGTREDLSDLYQSYRPGIAPLETLLNYLQRMIRRFDHIYILIDALDESPRNQEDARKHVLNTIKKIRSWSCDGLHLLVTSRDECDIRLFLKPLEKEKVLMRNDKVDGDIAEYISRQLNEDLELKEWPESHERIKETLSKGAKGVYVSPFRSLKSCPRSEYYLKQVLSSLPKSLDQTYERMLSSLDSEFARDVKRVLTLLCFARKPLTVPELIDGIAIQIDEPEQFNAERRLQDANDVRKLCIGLVEISTQESPGHYAGSGGYDFEDEDDRNSRGELVRIAHFSVQEYLVSDRIRKTRQAANFALEHRPAHTEIAQICLTHLLQPIFSGWLTAKGLLIKEYPFVKFAARQWHYHYTQSASFSSQVENLILKLFKFERAALATWAVIWDSERRFFKKRWRECNPGDNSPPPIDDTAASVYYASSLGLNNILHELLDMASREVIVGPPCATSADCNVSKLVNAWRGYHGSALQVACVNGHEKTVRLLFEKGADINAQRGEYGTALQAASLRGDESIVRLLLDNGANVNAQCGEYGTALQAALLQRDESIVRLLLDNGADVNAQCGRFGTVLQAASLQGDESIVRLLLDNGADVNAQCGKYGTALQAASLREDESIVRLLLDNGADVNAQCGEYGTALQAASLQGDESIVRLLLDNGADINAQCGRYGTALQAAPLQGDESIVRLLLDNGANVNAQCGEYGTALQAASLQRDESIVRLLLDNGANVNAQCGEYGTALQAASLRGDESIVRLLLEHGADVNAQCGRWGTALQAALLWGYESIVRLLLEHGADVNAQYGDQDTALLGASCQGHESIVRLLLDNGADVNAQYGDQDTALLGASCQGHESIVRLLLDNGADVNAQYGDQDTALSGASCQGHESIVRLLLDNGADVNAQCGQSTALIEASFYGHESIVRLLLEKGADINVQGGFNYTALQAALYSSSERENIIRLLLENGADASEVKLGITIWHDQMEIENLVLSKISEGANMLTRELEGVLDFAKKISAYEEVLDDIVDKVLPLLLAKKPIISAKAVSLAKYLERPDIMTTLRDYVQAQGGDFESLLAEAEELEDPEEETSSEPAWDSISHLEKLAG